MSALFLRMLSLSPVHQEGGKKKKSAFNDNKHSDNCVVLNELHFLVHLPHGIPAALPRANKTATFLARLDAIITSSLCIMWLKINGNKERRSLFECSDHISLSSTTPVWEVTIRLTEATSACVHLMVHYGLILRIWYVFISELAARRRGHSWESGVSLDWWALA